MAKLPGDQSNRKFSGLKVLKNSQRKQAEKRERQPVTAQGPQGMYLTSIPVRLQQTGAKNRKKRLRPRSIKTP